MERQAELFLGKCNLCGWPVVKYKASPFGTRCIRCFSTKIHRAVGLVLESLNISNAGSVYELSSRGALFAYLKIRFRNFYFSEFFDDVPPGEMKNGMPCQDVQNLKLGDGLFDLVTSTEVFEHVPDDRKSFAEIQRILKPNGYFVFTVPLLKTSATLERATLNPDGSIHYLHEPEYHSDRIRGNHAVLAFRTYGRDIKNKLNAAGFEAEIRDVRSRLNMIDDHQVIIAQKRQEL